MTAYNLIMLVIVLIAVLVVLIILLKPDPLADVEIEDLVDKFSIDYLLQGVLDAITENQNLNVEELNLNKKSIEKIERDQIRVEKSKELCAFGDADSKRFLKEMIKQILTQNLDISEETIDNTIHFTNYNLLSVRDKADILVYLYHKKFQKEGMTKFIQVNKLDAPVGEGYQEHYVISVNDVLRVFNQHKALIENLTYDDKLEILAQRIYASSWGLGVIDELLDMDVDGINCGTSGIPAPLHKYIGDLYSETTGDLPITSFNAVWLFFKGRLTHLAFYGFETEKEFERVAKRIYKYDNPGTLSANKGGIVNSRMDGSRVVVTRPPATENWAFFVRKLDAGAKMDIYSWFTDKGSDKIIETLKWIISGCLNLAITGEQGCGKTTLMMSVIDFVRHSFSIRTQEMSFELNLKLKFLLRNILAFRETDTFSGQQGINLQKKTDGSVNLMGEVADAVSAFLTIQTGQTGSNQVMFTGHMKTARLLVEYFRDCCCNVAGMTEKSAEALCASVLNTNLHLTKDVNGHRHAERITMVIPHVIEKYPKNLEEAQKEYYYRQTDRPIFDTIDLIKYVDGEYVFTGEFSEEMIERISSKITDKERYEFMEFCERMHKEACEYWAAQGKEYNDYSDGDSYDDPTLVNEPIVHEKDKYTQFWEPLDLFHPAVDEPANGRVGNFESMEVG